jgi:hypothetical protein
LSGQVKINKEIPLHGTKNGTISIGEIEKPYGEKSDPVVSVAISLSSDEPDWKVHIPFENLDEVISALENMRK